MKISLILVGNYKHFPKILVHNLSMEFMEKSASWSSLDVKERGFESVWFEGTSAHGSILRIDEDGNPYEMRYKFTWKNQFQIQSVSLETFKLGSLSLNLNYENGWYKDGELLTGFGDCTDIDLWPSPLTNTFAIRRLNLKVGESKKINVIWIHGATLELKKVTQVYTRIGEKVYEFHDPKENFTAALSVDNEGLVVVYPEFFGRL